MKRQSMRWLKGVTIVSFVFFLITISYAEQNASDVAGSVHSQYRDKAGSEKTIKQNFLNPLLGSDKLFTIDQTQSGNVQLACPGSKEFLTVLIKPKGTGDFDADIYWDSNMDGKMDKSMAVSNVSGICTNGFISCLPGTWTDCKNYTFEYNNGNIQLQEVGLTSLAGCFCINQSCGSNLLWNNVGYALKVFGGAVAGAFQKADSRYAISDARVDGAAIYFYGQRARDCSVVADGSGALYPESYYKSPYTITSTVENLVSSQSQDSKSFYSLMHSAYNQSQSISNLKSCTIRRNLSEKRIGVYDIIEPVGGNGGTVRSCGEKCIQVVLGWEGDNYWCASCSVFETYYDLLVKRPDLIGKATLVRSKWDDWIQVWFNNYLVWNGPYGTWTDPNGYPPGNCELSTSWDWGLNVDVTGYFKQYGEPHTLRTKNRVAVAGCGEGFSIVNIDTNTTCELIQNIESTCENYENNQNCVLWEETIDNVQTVRQGVRTGLSVIKQPITMCDRTYVFDWLLKSRVYLCKDQEIDLSGAKQRLATVIPSSQYSSDRITFTDIRKEGNTWNTYANQQFIIGGGVPGESCEKACKVKASRPNVGVGLSGRVSEANSGDVNYVYYYRPCYNNTCPIEEGETIEVQCKCMDDFGSASTVMQSMRMAGQDMICTSGNIKTLPGY